MASRPSSPLPLPVSDARRIWMRAQRLDEREPFGSGPQATLKAVEHLGYVQIDTIHVIERSHHHILYSRIPSYERGDLHQAQTIDRSVFEYWTHALAYVPTSDFRFFVREMRRQREHPEQWFGSVTRQDIRKALARLRREGPLTIRDIDDDVLVEKHHPWASRKPTKRALQLAFHQGLVAISRREGMLKTYDLIDRHFGWERPPRPATEKQIAEYMLERALRSQGVVSLDSICHLAAPWKPAVRTLIDQRVRRRALRPVAIEGAGRQEHWAPPEVLEEVFTTPTSSFRLRGEVGPAQRRPSEGQAAAASTRPLRRHPLSGGQRVRASTGSAAPSQRAAPSEGLVHILSPFDPLVIQRKRLKLFFGYDHLFEAYLPKEKRRLGYFALPVLLGDEIVAAIDLKADREKSALLVQQWSWVGNGSAREHKRLIEKELGRFEQFQLSTQKARPSD